VAVTLKVVTWSDDAEGRELAAEAVALHPDGVAATVAAVVRREVPTAEVLVRGLHEPNDGLPAELLVGLDVLVWWGHEAHDRVADATAARVVQAVDAGLGLLVLHSGHLSKPFVRLMGTSCELQWRDDGSDEELIWIAQPDHPIAAGIEAPIRAGSHEMYGEPFHIPQPDTTVFISAFTGGEVFRSGCCFTRGKGRIFYFSPGHETYPVYANPQIERVLGNAVRWLGGVT
jgi:trehalose utilization protein